YNDRHEIIAFGLSPGPYLHNSSLRSKPGQYAGSKITNNPRLECFLRYTPPNAENPPSTQIIDPVTKREASLRSHSNAPCNSSGWPNRLKGVCLITSSPRAVYPPSGLVRRALFCSVRKNPGASAFIRTRSP